MFNVIPGCMGSGGGGIKGLEGKGMERTERKKKEGNYYIGQD